MTFYGAGPSQPNDHGAYRLEDMVFRMADATRSLGWEEGTDLLLQLIYLRWAVEQGPESRGWHAFSNELLATANPAELLVRALKEYLQLQDVLYRSVAQDGGHALRQTVDTLSQWTFEAPSADALRHELHHAFEAVLRMRSQRLSRAGVEHETPGSAARLIARLVPVGGRVVDPACGIGSLLLEAATAATADPSTTCDFVGWDINTHAASVARMRFALAGVPLTLHVADTLTQLRVESIFDTVLMQPPWGVRLGDPQWQSLPVLPFGKPGRSSSDFVWLQLAAQWMSAQGRAAALMNHGTLTRGHSEGDIRQRMVQAGLVEAVISFPAGLVPAASVGSCIWLLRREPTPATAGQVLLMDATSVVEQHRGRAELTPDGIEQLIGTVEAWRSGRAIEAPTYLAATRPVEDLLEIGDLLPARHLTAPPAERPIRPSAPSRLLTELRVGNFKSFSDEQRVPLAPITLIYGPNSAGKSSVLQTLLLLKQSVAANSLVTQGTLTDAGSFTGAIHRHELGRTLKLGLSFGSSERWDIPEGVPDPGLLRSVDVPPPARPHPSRREQPAAAPPARAHLSPATIVFSRAFSRSSSRSRFASSAFIPPNWRCQR